MPSAQIKKGIYPMKKEITVQELIDQLNQIENKNMPIDVQMSGCYGKDPSRYRIGKRLVFHQSDVLHETRAVSIEFERGQKTDIVTDIIDGYEPLTVSDCEDIFADRNMSEEDKELITTAINFERKSKQKFANINKMKETMND